MKHSHPKGERAILPASPRTGASRWTWYGPLQAALGASEMTQDNEALNPSRYRQARALNREGRRALVALGASASEALEQVLIG